jgi:hypothetical protein
MIMDSWNELYRQLWMEAAQSRGTAMNQGELPGSPRYQTATEWPRTLGSDAIAIASLIDPILDEVPLRPGGYGIARLWQSAVIDLEGSAFADPAAEYAHNRMWWSTLLAVAAHLSAVEAPLPSADAWSDVLAGIWAPAIGGRRNAHGPTTHVITESTHEKMWDAQHAEMIQAHGFDVRETPLGELGRPMKVPRTTNADVVRLADYWGKQLVPLQLDVMLGRADNTMGFQGEQTRWHAAMADVETYARHGTPSDIYPKNHELWRAMLSLATTLGGFGQVPSSFEMAIEATKLALADLPGRIADAAGNVAHAIGNVAHEASLGLLAGFGKPLVLGGGALLALYLLLRHHPSHAEAA